MPIVLDADAARARDLAKRSVAEGAELDAMTLLRAVAHATHLEQRLVADVVAALPPLVPRVDTPPERVPVAKALQPLLNALADQHAEVSALRLLIALLGHADVQRELVAKGLSADTLAASIEQLKGAGTAAAEPAAGAPSPRDTAQRRRLADALSSFGRLLTLHPPPDRAVDGLDAAINKLVTRLCMMKNRCGVVTGPPGVGKSAVVYELARRIHRGDDTIPEAVRNVEIFELAPLFLRSGASYVGQYEERLKTLLDIVERHRDEKARREVVVFIDEIHTFISSGMHERDPFSQANEALKDRITQGRLVVLGCTTSAEYRHYIAPDPAWQERLPEIRLEPPDAEATLKILRARLGRLAAHYAPLHIADELLARTVALTDQYMPAQAQPRKAIQVLDEACAISVVRRPPAVALDEDALLSAIETRVGRGVVRRGPVDPHHVLLKLAEKVIGQDECLATVSACFSAGLGRSWTDATERPRGVWMFCGPTGVGKTETALELAHQLGGGADALVRIDCNTLQGSGFDSRPSLNVLLGAPPGYLGYVRGQGGLLSRVRDRPECIVLFDEIEKADPGVAKTLLQILDKGRVEDTEGRMLDFRRAFIIFTTNAGCRYGETSHEAGFGAGPPAPDEPHPVTQGEVQAALRAIGYGEEVFGRIDAWLSFAPMQRESIRTIVVRELEKLQARATARGFDLDWDPLLVEALLAAWRPRLGARHAVALVRNRIVGQLEIAQATNQLDGVKTIRLRAQQPLAGDADDALRGNAARQRAGNVMTIDLA